MLISCRCSCADTVPFVQELRELAIEGTVKGSLPDQRNNTLGVAFKGGKALPLSQTVAFAEAYMKKADLPKDHLKRIKNLVRPTPFFFLLFQPYPQQPSIFIRHRWPPRQKVVPLMNGCKHACFRL